MKLFQEIKPNYMSCKLVLPPRPILKQLLNDPPLKTWIGRNDKAVLSAAGCMTDVITLNKVLIARLTQ